MSRQPAQPCNAYANRCAIRDSRSHCEYDDGHQQGIVYKIRRLTPKHHQTGLVEACDSISQFSIKDTNLLSYLNSPKPQIRFTSTRQNMKCIAALLVLSTMCCALSVALPSAAAGSRSRLVAQTRGLRPRLPVAKYAMRRQSFEQEGVLSAGKHFETRFTSFFVIN